MNKPKFSLEKAKRAVEISSKIEGHKISTNKADKTKKPKAKVKD